MKTLKEFKNAILSNEGLYMVNIKEHKMSSTSGHRVIISAKPLQKVFALCGNAKCIAWHRYFTIRSTVFVRWAGRAMSSSLIGDKFA